MRPLRTPIALAVLATAFARAVPPAIFAAGALSAAFAQDTATFHSTVERALIPCSVVDAQGAPVSGLTPGDFRVTDNGIRRTVEHVWPAADLPLTLGILIDASDSQRERLAEHRQTAAALLERLLHPADRAFAVSIGANVRLWADLSGSPADLRARLGASPLAPFGQPCAIAACGASPLWNTVYDAARLKLASLAGNKAVLLLTDGFDTGSPRTWREAAAEAQKAGAAVYAIAYPSESGAVYAPDLNRLVAESGGAVFRPPNGDYSAILDRLETDLRRGYVLSFRPEALTGKIRHEVEVEVTRPDLIVRARKSYFAPPL